MPLTMHFSFRSAVPRTVCANRTRFAGSTEAKRFRVSRAIKGALCHVLLSLSALPALADDYPSKPIRLVVSFPAGAGTDLIARVVGAELQNIWGQQVIVENKPGAAGNIAAETVLRAPADGYTLLIVNSTFTANVGLFPKLPFNPITDFQPITRLGASPMVIAAAGNTQFDNLGQMVTAAKSAPGALSYASCGNGGPPHIVAEQFFRLHGANVTHIPYKGCAPATTDVVGGQVPILFTNYLSVKPYLPTGRLKALAVTLRERSPLAPDIPTVRELGFGDITTDLWFGLVARAGTPQPVVEKLSAAVARALSSPSVREKLNQQAVEPQPDSRQAFGQFLKEEVALYSRLVKELDIKLD